MQRCAFNAYAHIDWTGGSLHVCKPSRTKKENTIELTDKLPTIIFIIIFMIELSQGFRSKAERQTIRH